MERLWKTRDLMEFMGLETPQGVYHGVARGTLPPPIRMGQRLRWHPRKVYEWLGLDYQPCAAQVEAPPGPQRRRGPGRPRKGVQQ
jgi:predicted DNA-binding transcriptional regulator AlpA